MIYVNVRSNSYVQDSSQCEFLITSFESQWGVLENPKHSLPPNTTCRYNFQGRRQETVWISFVKYYASNAELISYDLSTECNTRLRVWNGRVDTNTETNNITLLGEFCRDEVPRLCDHALLSNATRFTRPCARAESYVSSGSELTIEQHLRQGSALFPFSFILRYEFVDVTQEGSDNKNSENLCDRVFNSSYSPLVGRFHSPKSIFFYGRGGTQNISCVLRFESNQNEKIKLTLIQAKFGERECSSKIDERTNRYQCLKKKPGTKNNRNRLQQQYGVAELRISEYPWPEIQIPRDCFCSNIDESLTIESLTSSVVEVNFTITLMNITQDYNDFYFEGEYEFYQELDRNDENDKVCPTKKENRRLRKPSGEIQLSSSSYINRKHPQIESMIIDSTDDNGYFEKEVPDSYCVNYPWLIEPEDKTNNFIYLKTYGFELPTETNKPPYNCHTTNRIIIYSGVNTKNPKVICPADRLNIHEMNKIEVFSDGWNTSLSKNGGGGGGANGGGGDPSAFLLTPHARSFIIEFLQKEFGNHIISWMEVSKRPVASSNIYANALNMHDCSHM